MKVVSLPSRQTAELSENHSIAARWLRNNGKPLGGDLVIAGKAVDNLETLQFPGWIRGLNSNNIFDRLIARFVSSGKRRRAKVLLRRC
jgi:hypothetical protein